MPTKEVDHRLSTLRDDKLITHTAVVKEHYIAHQDNFKGFNASVFHDNYHQDMQGKIDLAEDTTSDAFILKTQAMQTSKLEQYKSELSLDLHSIDFIVKKVFIDDEAVIKEFRLNKIYEVAKSPDSLIGFSKDVLVMAKNYKEELATEGLTDEKIVELKDKIEKYDKQRRVQVEAMHTRPLHTKDRIQKMNNLWSQLCELRDASDIIFANDPELKALFALPKAHAKSEEHDEDGIIKRYELIDSVDDSSISNIA